MYDTVISTDTLLRALVDATASVTGQEFFDALTRTLYEVLDANNVALSQPTRLDSLQIETLSHYHHGAPQANIVYSIANTPCRNVLGQSYVHVPDNVVSLYPFDTFLVETQTRSYIGVPVSTPDNRTLGLLTLCFGQPTHHLAHLRDVLTLFASRAAAELERLAAERALREAHASLDRRVRDRTAELSTVTSHIPCILWRTALHLPHDWRQRPSRIILEEEFSEFQLVDVDAAQRLLPLDVPPGDRYGRAWGRSLHADDRNVAADTTFRALSAGLTRYAREFRCTDRHGELHWLHEDVVVEPLGVNPNHFMLFGVVTDVTHRRHTEQALRSSEQRYDVAARAGRVGIWEWDLANSQIFLSDNLKALLGYPADYPLEDGPTWHDLLHPDDIKKVIDATDSHLGFDVPYELEVRRRHRDGTYRWFLSRGGVLRDPMTRVPLRMTGTLTDITDRKRAEEALRLSEHRYALATDAGRVGIWEYDYVGDRIYVSPQLCSMHGRPTGYFTDFQLWRSQTHPDDRVQVNAVRADAAAPRFELEVRRLHADGSYRWFLSSGTIRRDPDGKPLTMTGTLKDITDRKRAEEALRDSEQAYRQAADTNRRLLLELDHRLRNQLAGLVSLVTLMRDRATSVPEFADAIEARLRAMSHVHHLLSQSQWKDLDLQTLLTSLLAQPPHGSGLQLSGPTVALPAPQALPLSLILAEFLTNSQKYGALSVPAGKVAITWSCNTSRPPHPILSLTWTERCGPPITIRPAPSLGTSLIQSFATRELGGTCSLTYPTPGATHNLTFPLRK